MENEVLQIMHSVKIIFQFTPLIHLILQIKKKDEVWEKVKIAKHAAQEMNCKTKTK